jgi:hypothetical protein
VTDQATVALEQASSALEQNPVEHEAEQGGQSPTGEGQPKIVMMMPPVNWGVSETPDGKQVVLTFQTIYGTFQVTFDPNKGLDYARAVRSKCKDLNLGVTVVRPTLLGANGQVLATTAADDDEDEAGEAQPASDH